MKKSFMLVLLLALVFPLFAQQEKEHEVSSEVKELADFHDVIYQIWHTAWPEKDIKLLISFVAPVENGFEKIKKAELPGILRDKKSKWDEGVKKYGEFVEMYKNTAAKKDSVGLLNAAEKLHAQYEMLVRVIKPVMKEVDAFHQVLYKLYHYYMPENNVEKIKEAAAALTVKSEELNKALTPKKMQTKEELFNKARTELTSAVDNLNKVLKAEKGKEAIDKAVDGVHSKYEELEGLFK